MSLNKDITIVYQPGFGGNFLTYLFSLDPITVPHAIDTDNVDIRLEHYNFSKTKNFDSWMHYHAECSGIYYRSKEKNDQLLIECVHPNDFVHSFDKIYYIANLSYNDFANYWLVATKKKWGDFPELRLGEFEKELEIRKKYNPLEINVDSFLDLKKWEDEYIRVSDSMKIPLQLKSARLLYQSWYNIRVEPLLDEFKKISTEEKNNFFLIRKEQEKYPPSGLLYKYHQLKGVDWPNIKTEDEFDTLPLFVKNELINKFNIKPSNK